MKIQRYEHWRHLTGQFNGYGIMPDELKPLRDNVVNKIHHTVIMAEFAFKCLYPGEKPLSKKDYGRTRRTHELLYAKMSNLYSIKTETENENFQRGWRKMQIGKGLYPFGINENEGIEKYLEIKKYYETGRYKIGGFVDKFIANIHHI